MAKEIETGDSNEHLDNGYPFRDDIINFHIKYKKKKYFFEFPVLLDRSMVLREIKERTRVRGQFCLYWCKPEKEVNKDKKKKKIEASEEHEEIKSTVKQKPATLVRPRKEEFYLHSSSITTLSLRKFCGQTLEIREGDASK